MDLTQLVGLFKNLVPVPDNEILSIARAGDTAIYVELTSGARLLFSIRKDSTNWWSLQTLGRTK